jgi:2-polyprenyl-3-methyl-5-hydroxy-6-metoxy-1,4-benzoquinol methylase
LKNVDRLLDKSYLSVDAADERVIRHRDVNSHAFRWAHVARQLSQNQLYKRAIVLDVGCGIQMGMAKMLYSNRLIPRKYVGVDANEFDIPEMLAGKKLPITIWSSTDACMLDPEDVALKDGDRIELPNILVCFEVLEHVRAEHERRMLTKFKELTSDDCQFFISTPCWDMVNCAQNHINEQKAQALGALFEDLGYKIDGMWGTFASQREYVPVMESRFPGIAKIFEKLSEYYDSTVISTTFAPLFPMESRNILWRLTKKRGDAEAQKRLFPALAQVPPPWTSDPGWIGLSGFSHQHTADCEVRDAEGNAQLHCGKEGVWLGK